MKFLNKQDILETQCNSQSCKKLEVPKIIVYIFLKNKLKKLNKHENIFFLQNKLKNFTSNLLGVVKNDVKKNFSPDPPSPHRCFSNIKKSGKGQENSRLPPFASEKSQKFSGGFAPKPA